nr:hypothetical protein [Mesorhizobium sp. LSJC277A00]
MKIDAVQMNHIDRPSGAGSGDRFAMSLLRAALRRLVEHAVFSRYFHKGTARAGAAAANDDRAVAGANQPPIENRQNLFGTADSIGSDGCERVGDIEDSERRGWLRLGPVCRTTCR